MPSVRVNADYGRLGRTIPDTETTYSLSGTVTVPIFNGGRSAGRLLQADADLRARQAELADIRAGIDFDIRAIYLDLETSREELQVATRSRELASQQLVQARDRLTAGVANNIEVVQAQQAVAAANESYTAASYNNFIAKALLASAVGLLDDLTRQGFGGARQ
jgi:outer membrane protein TolC